MPTITFKISDSQKYDFLWFLLNVNYNEESNWLVEYGICDIYDEYAIVRNYAEGVFERVYYTKNNETDSLEITSRERCYIVDVTESEKNALQALHSMNENTYEAVDTKFNALNEDWIAANATIAERDETINSLNEEISLNNTKIEELGSEIATLNQEKTDAVNTYTAANEQIVALQSSLDEANVTIASITAEKDELAKFQKKVWDDEKKALINGYANQLSEDLLDTYIENMDKYSLKELDMELTYELKKNHPEIFSKGTPPAYVPKEDTHTGGLNAILAKYKK